MWVAHTTRLICRQKCRILQSSQKCSFTDILIFRPPRVTKPVIRAGLGYLQTQSCHFSRYHLPYQISSQSRPHTLSFFNSVQQVINSSDHKKFSTMLWALCAVTSGRGLNKWYARLDPGRRETIWQYFVIHGVWLSVIFGGLAYYWTHLQAAPITGRKRFISFSEAQTQEMDKSKINDQLIMFRHKMCPDNDPRIQRGMGVINKLVSNNAEIQKSPIQKWDIHIIKDSIVDAFVLPSGHIFIFEGFLELLQTDDQLAIILGHEMAHAVLSHGGEIVSLRDIEQFFIVVSLFYISCVVSSILLAIAVSGFFITSLVMFTYMPHSRQLEWEADFVGLVFAANACYDIHQAGPLRRKIADHERETYPLLTSLPQWIKTHPDGRKRADFFDSLKVEAERWREEKGCPKLPPELIT